VAAALGVSVVVVACLSDPAGARGAPPRAIGKQPHGSRPWAGLLFPVRCVREEAGGETVMRWCGW